MKACISCIEEIVGGLRNLLTAIDISIGTNMICNGFSFTSNCVKWLVAVFAEFEEFDKLLRFMTVDTGYSLAFYIASVLVHQRLELIRHK